MTKQIFLVSDTHFAHDAMYSRPFLDGDGNRLRPWGSDEEATEAMVERWNSVVGPHDKVYHLGDVAIGKAGVQVLDRLNGDKVLIAGNHDWPWERALREKFRSIRAYWKLEDFTLSHVPIHSGSLRNFYGNIHGHTHGYEVLANNGLPDCRYISVCVERIDYTPIEFSCLRELFRKRVECYDHSIEKVGLTA